LVEVAGGFWLRPPSCSSNSSQHVNYVDKNQHGRNQGDGSEYLRDLEVKGQ